MAQEDYRDFQNCIEECSKKILKPDLMKVGDNFRAISEAAILEAINPVFNEFGFDYNVDVLDSELVIKETSKKYVFVATCRVRLTFISDSGDEVAHSEALGMGIDDGDKAMGKAYTYAVKYALLKKLRLRYSDDPDVKQSEPIQPKEEKAIEKKETKEKTKRDPEGPKVTEKMSAYLEGLAIQCKLSYEAFKAEFGFYPNDKKISQREARAVIDTLKARVDDDLPF